MSLPLPSFVRPLRLQLLRIEEELGSKAVYAGQSFRTPSWMG